MSPKTRNISPDIITREVIKALLLANTGKKKVIAEILSKLNIKPLIDISYRSIDFTAESLCRCILFMELKGLNQSDLELYLKTHKNERKKLGLQRSPDQSMISYFIKHKLDEESKNIIRLIVKKIEEFAGKKEITLDVLKIKRKKKRSKKTGKHYLKNRMTREVSKLFRRRILPFINFKLKHNCVYNQKTLINLILYIAKEKDFAENGADSLREYLKKWKLSCPKCNSFLYPKAEFTDDDFDENRFMCLKCGFERRISPVGATFRYELKKIGSPSEILDMFIRIFAVLWEMTPESRALKRTESIVAIDNTEVFFYGKKDNPYIVGKKFEKGAKYCYKFMTINIVQAGKRYTLLSLPYTQLDNQQDLLKELIEFAKQRIRIKLALLDRGYWNTNSQKLLQSYGIKYIMPCIKNDDVKETLKLNPTPFVLNDCVMKNELKYNMAAITHIDEKGQKEIHAFATNILLDDTNMKKEAYWIAEEYRKRWGIETSFRVIKQSFLPKTTSKNYRIRLFYFLFSVLLYNMWILADVLVCIDLIGRVSIKHIVNANFFREVFFFIDPGG